MVVMYQVVVRERKSGTVVQQFEARAPTRAYVVRTRDEGNAIDVVANIFLNS